MREFLLTVDVSNLSENTELVFIPGYTASPTPWDEVENHNARRLRAFSATGTPGNSRRIYFSVSPPGRSLISPTTGKSGGTNVSLSSDLAPGQSERELLDQRQSGLMAPDTDYYVHAYTEGGRYLASSAKITTIDYPTTVPTNPIDPRASIEPAFWNMSMWQDSNGALIPLEFRTGELVHLPYRFIPLFDAAGPGNPCAAVSTITMSVHPVTGKSYDIYIGNYPVVETEGRFLGTSVVQGSSRISGNYYDLSALAGGFNGVDTPGSYEVRFTTDCAPQVDPSTQQIVNNAADKSAANWPFTAVSE